MTVETLLGFAGNLFRAAARLSVAFRPNCVSGKPLRFRAGSFMVGALLAVPLMGAAQLTTPPGAADEGARAVTAGDPQFLSSYKLGPGDVITIRVFGEDDLSREKIKLTDSGSLFLPGVGELVALGKTLGEVERLAVDRLKGRILVNPQVSVFVEEYRPFFINGMVDKPGGYPFQPGLTVRKAAAVAGGFKERASLNKIFLIRSGDRNQQALKVDLNTVVLPGDIVTVEESFF